jgi:hypothetical protein
MDSVPITAPPKGRKKVAKDWWRTRTDPLAASWPMLQRWLAAEPNITGKELIARLSNQLLDLYPTGAQLRGLQRRVKAWSCAVGEAVGIRRQ